MKPQTGVRATCRNEVAFRRLNFALTLIVPEDARLSRGVSEADRSKPRSVKEVCDDGVEFPILETAESEGKMTDTDPLHLSIDSGASIRRQI